MGSGKNFQVDEVEIFIAGDGEVQVCQGRDQFTITSNLTLNDDKQ